MDNAMRAEHLLERLYLPHHQAALRGLDHARLLDVSYVALLKAVNRVLALRGTIAGSSDSILRSQERAAKYKERCKEVAGKCARKLEEAKARENDLGSKLLAAQVDQDEWAHRCQEAESQAAIARAQSTAAEMQLMVVRRALERARDGIDELTQQLHEADSRANRTVFDAYATERRAEEAVWATQEANQRMAQAEAATAEVAAQVRDAEARAEGAERRAAEEVATAVERVREAEARVQVAVHEFRGSSDFEQEVVEASLDAYAKGFDQCKVKEAAIHKVEGLDAIQPDDSDDAEADEEEVGEDSKPAEP